MVEALERWAMTIAMTIVVSFAWFALCIDNARVEPRAATVEITAADMPLRDASEPALAAVLGDPCKLDLRAPSLANVKAGAADATSHAPLSAQSAASATGAVLDRSTTSAVLAPIDVPRPSESRVLTLDSILAFPGGTQANICGQAISVGAPVHGVDMESPPILAWIDGVRAGVKYKGRVYVLDLDRERRVSLDAHASDASPHGAPHAEPSHGASPSAVSSTPSADGPLRRGAKDEER
jgi:hypothetical protein